MTDAVALQAVTVALPATTGKQLWSRTLIRNDHEGIDMAPGYNDGTVYVSTVYSPGSHGFNARTGAEVFSFPDGSYTTVVADRNALFLMGKYTLYKFVPHSAEVPNAKRDDRRPKRRRLTKER